MHGFLVLGGVATVLLNLSVLVHADSSSAAFAPVSCAVQRPQKVRGNVLLQLGLENATRSSSSGAPLDRRTSAGGLSLLGQKLAGGVGSFAKARTSQDPGTLIFILMNPSTIIFLIVLIIFIYYLWGGTTRKLEIDPVGELQHVYQEINADPLSAAQRTYTDVDDLYSQRQRQPCGPPC
mmetsp:Transcript_100989/g.182244  ORF Transcript_100989/g.182244 Transcript_100989/m.182244 type:complete len:179 (+) Transcript_100989:63-599(+)